MFRVLWKYYKHGDHPVTYSTVVENVLIGKRVLDLVEKKYQENVCITYESRKHIMVHIKLL